KLPWGVLLLFGGGLALSAQFTDSRLTEWIGEVTADLGGLPVVLIVVIAAAGILFLTELTSNTATAATFLPVATAVATGIGIDPMLLAIPVAIAATCAFMLPVATPPNAIAYGSGYVSIPQMARAGIWLNLIGIVLISMATLTLAVWVLDLTYCPLTPAPAPLARPGRAEPAAPARRPLRSRPAPPRPSRPSPRPRTPARLPIPA